MRVEIKFDPVSFKTLCTQRWDNEAKKAIVVYSILFLGGLVFFILSIFMIRAQDKSGYIFLSISSCTALMSGYFLLDIVKKKKKYFKEVNSVIKDHAASDEPAVWNFTEEFVDFKDHRMELKMRWDRFTHYSIKLKTLQLHYKSDKENSPQIIEELVGTQKFQEIIEFVKLNYLL